MEDRLLVFEVGDVRYALPIANVVEVAEPQELACVPTLPTATGGVVNHHGDALPVLRRSALFGLDEERLSEPTHLVVVSLRAQETARLGFPVDRIAGLVDGAARGTGRGELVSERRPIDGRVVGVLDPGALVERARRAIELSLATSG
jgi:chemotaxis signal transduction protein